MDANQLKAAGFSDDEVNGYVSTQTRGLLAAGFTGPEISTHLSGRRTASGVVDAIQAGYQGSATGLAVRGRLPDVVLDSSHSTWYEKAAAGIGQVVSEIPEMIVGGAAGGMAGTTAGGAAGSAVPVLGNLAGAIAGGIVGTGAGAFAVPAAIRESLVQAYTRGEVTSAGDFLNRTAIVLKTTGKEALVGAATFGAGAVAARVAGAAIAPAVGQSMTVGTARTAIGAAQAGTELGTMVVTPAALDGHLPEWEDFLNAAIVLGGVKASVGAAGRIARVYSKAGVPPEQVVADAKADPALREAIVDGPDSIPAAYGALAAAENARQAVPGERAATVAESPFAEVPQAAAEPARPTHVNYNFLNSSEDVAGALARLSQVYEADIQTQRRGAVTWEQTSAEAAKILADTLGGTDLRVLMPREPGTPAGAAEILARKQLTIGAAEDMATRARDFLAKGTEASAEDTAAFLASIERAAMIQSEFLGARAEAGRALNILKSTAMDAERAQQIKEVIDLYGNDPVRLARMVQEIDTAAGALKFAERMTKATTWEKVVEAWKAGLVSGPITHVANVLGNTTFVVLRVPIETISAGVGLLMHTGAERVSFVEPVARVVGALQGAVEGLKVAGAVLRTGAYESGKGEQYRKAIEGTKGEVIRLPFRALAAEDALFRTMNQRGEAYSLGVHQAVGEGLNPFTREFRERVAELVNNPTPEMTKEIEAAGQRFTFNAPLGEKGRAVQEFVRAWHLEWAVPFVRTPGNIFKELTRMTPFAPFIAEWRADFEKGGAAADKATAEIMFGGAVFSAVGMAVFSGTLSGAGAPDPNKRRIAQAAGWQPYSVKVGDKWYSYQRLQPLGTLMGLAADVAETWEHLTPEESDQIPKMLSLAFANAVTNQTFLQGLSNIVNAMSDPTRFGPRFIQGLAASTVPGVVAQTAQLGDPLVREIYSALDAVKNRIPGLRESLQPRRDAFGVPIENRERMGGVSPITATTESTDKVRTEAMRLGVSVAAVPDSITLPAGSDRKLGTVKLTPEQRDIFADEAGHLAHESLTAMVNSPAWDGLPDMVKRRSYDIAFDRARAGGRAAALSPEQRQAEAHRIAEEITRRLAQ